MFSVVNGVRFRPLPCSKPDHLATLWEGSPQRSIDQKGWQELKFTNPPRYDADFAGQAAVIRGKKEFAYTATHDLAVQESVLRASGLPVD